MGAYSKMFKTEFYPDGFDDKGNPVGPCAMVLHFHKPNSKRWGTMTTKEKVLAANLMEEFCQKVNAARNALLDDASKQPS
jgi:hypothetical protein